MQLSLPYRWGEAYAVVQGQDGLDTHQGRERYAVDFAMPEGTPVLAAAAGRVVAVLDDFTEHGRETSFAERANVIVVDMGEGAFATYRHLAAHSAAVHEGEAVLRGQLLGRSGNTGMSVNPHLHFAVVDHANRSLPIAFLEGPARGGLRPQSQNGAPPPSHLPRDAFAANGIVLDVDLPLAPWSDKQPPRIKGHATGTDHVVAFLVNRADGSVACRAASPVTPDGTFDVALSLDGIEGPFDFAMAGVDPEGGFHSDFGVPIVVRRLVVVSRGEVQ